MQSMRWSLPMLFLGVIAIYSPEPGAGADDVLPPTTESQAKRGWGGLLFDSSATAAPFIGMLGFGDPANNYKVRPLLGVTLDLFLIHGTFEEGKPIAYGFETGLFGAGVESSAYAFLWPIMFKGTDRFTEHLWVEGSLGAELLYRTVNRSMSVGRGDLSEGRSLEPFPSFGVTVDWKLSPKAALSVRGEYIPTPATDMFSVAVGAVFPAG
jgi:hypothetical protein